MLNGLPEPGDVIADKYMVECELGRGGMGTVYRVVHRVTGKRLALKCLLPKYVDNPTLVERFVREARAAGRIHHRHVIDVFDVGRERDLLYIVMPQLEGKPLSELLKDEALRLDEALVVLMRAMEGVEAAHALGIVHRDLKPQNIFVCVGVSGRLDDPRVLDFGISKLDDELGSPLTHSGVAVGTPYYMSLEQLTGQRDLDQRVDIYAMGVILYEAVAGKLPHRAENVASLAIQLMHTAPAHLSALRPDLPRGLADAIMRALARHREQRYADMRALIDAIAPFVQAGTRDSALESQGLPLRTPRESNPTVSLADIARASATTAPSPAHGSELDFDGDPHGDSNHEAQRVVPAPSAAPRPSAASLRRAPLLALLTVVLALPAAILIWRDASDGDEPANRTERSAARVREPTVRSESARAAASAQRAGEPTRAAHAASLAPSDAHADGAARMATDTSDAQVRPTRAVGARRAKDEQRPAVRVNARISDEVPPAALPAPEPAAPEAKDASAERKESPLDVPRGGFLMREEF
jgi:serine/threonine-protein kinase